MPTEGTNITSATGSSKNLALSNNMIGTELLNPWCWGNTHASISDQRPWVRYTPPVILGPPEVVIEYVKKTLVIDKANKCLDAEEDDIASYYQTDLQRCYSTDISAYLNLNNIIYVDCFFDGSSF